MQGLIGNMGLWTVTPAALQAMMGGLKGVKGRGRGGGGGGLVGGGCRQQQQQPLTTGHQALGRGVLRRRVQKHKAGIDREHMVLCTAATAAPAAVRAMKHEGNKDRSGKEGKNVTTLPRKCSVAGGAVLSSKRDVTVF